MNYHEYKYLVLSDLYRVTGNTKRSAFVYQLLLGEAYKYIFGCELADILEHILCLNL